MTPIKLEPLFTATLNVGPPQLLGATPNGDRRIVQVQGGSFTGPRLNGTVLAGGGDWIVVRPDASTMLDVRLTLQTDDKALIYMTYRGFRHGPAAVIERLNKGEAVDPAEYYFRIAPLFETGASKYGWLNRTVCVGTGRRLPAGPIYDVYEVL